MITCPSAKIGYPSPQEAWRAATHIRRRVRTTAADRHTRNSTHAYRCSFCSQWHTSGTPRRTTP